MFTYPLTFAFGEPNTGTTQVFINYGVNGRLDRAGFAPFGEVIQGMEVVDRLHCGYGDGPPRSNGPNAARVLKEGNVYLAEISSVGFDRAGAHRRGKRTQRTMTSGNSRGDRLSDEIRSIGIVGGGPAGLVAAIAARHAGYDVTVFEQTPSFARIGGAIGIQSNGLRVLDALGVLPRFQPHIELVGQAAVEAPPGRRIMHGDFRELDIPHPHFAVALRFHLQEVLLASALDQGAEVTFGQRCMGVTAADERVQLSFENGESAEVDLVFAL